MARFPLRLRSFSIPAGKQERHNLTGALFRVKKATHPFLVTFDDDETMEVEAGIGVRYAGGDHFKKLTFKNESAATLNFEAWVGGNTDGGGVIIEDSRPNVSPGSSLALNVRDEPSDIDGTLYSLAAGTLVEVDTLFTGQTRRGWHRKQIVITNDSGVDAVYLWNPANTYRMARIKGGQSITLFTSANFRVKNEGGAAADILFCATFYQST